MNKFRKHIPDSVDHDPQEWVIFETTEDLLKMRWVKSFSEDEDFSHYAIDGHHLMQITNNGFNWWVIGTILDPSKINLPKWDGGKWRAKFPDGTEKVLTDEVISSCGGELTLKDGTKVINMKYGIK